MALRPAPAWLVRYVGAIMASRSAVWVRKHPSSADGLLAAALGAIALPSPFLAGGSPRPGDALAVILVLGETLPLIFRRGHPDMVLVALGGAALAYNAAGYGAQPAWPALVVAVYSFAAHRRSGAQLWALAALCGELSASFLAHSGHSGLIIAGLQPAALVALPVAFAVGHIIRNRRADNAHLSRRAERAEAEREAAGRRAVAEERARIARELHDVVAHALGVIVMQAGGAARVADLDPALAKDVLGSIEQAGRQAFTEMRRLVDVLRDDDRTSDLAPPPTIDALGSLLAQFRQAGVAVTMEVEGRARRIGAGAELSVYRIVQEALTNTLKHAGGVPATVRLSWSHHDLTVEIVDSGIPNSPGTPCHADSGGHGLVGMRERVSVFGGNLSAGPRDVGGFVVRAQLPLSGAEAATAPTLPSP